MVPVYFCGMTYEMRKVKEFVVFISFYFSTLLFLSPIMISYQAFVIEMEPNAIQNLDRIKYFQGDCIIQTRRRKTEKCKSKFSPSKEIPQAPSCMPEVLNCQDIPPCFTFLFYQIYFVSLQLTFPPNFNQALVLGLRVYTCKAFSGPI